jgi:hypothetical protein
MCRRSPLQTKYPEFSVYLVKTISSYLNCRAFEAFFQTTTSIFRYVGAGVAEGGIISPILFSWYVNDTPSSSRHVELGSLGASQNPDQFSFSGSQSTGSKQPVTLEWSLMHGLLVDAHRWDEKATRGLGVLGPLLNRGSELSLRNGVLLYKQLIRPMMDYACSL